MRFYREGNLLWLVARAIEIGVPLAFVASGGAARLAGWAERRARSWFGRFVLFAAVAFALWSIATLPLAWWAGFSRPHRYGLSTETFAHWLGACGKGFLVQLAVIVGVGWVPWRLMVARPRRWWAWTATLALPFFFLVLYLAPLVIDPLFNEYKPLPEGPLRDQVMALAADAGIADSRLFVAGMSIETRAVNAYVTGFLGSHRIVLWDTLVASLQPDEVLAVVGHEIGHYVLGHVWRTLVAVGALTFFALWATARLTDALVARRGARWGVAGSDSLAALPLVLAIVAVVSLVLSPVGLALSRYHERAADRYGTALTGNPEAMGRAFIALQVTNLSNPRPGPVYTLLRASHPSLSERVARAAAATASAAASAGAASTRR